MNLHIIKPWRIFFSDMNKGFFILLRITKYVYFVSNAKYSERFCRANKKVDISISFRKNMQYSCIDIIIDLYVCLCQNHEKYAFYNKNYNIQIGIDLVYALH